MRVERDRIGEVILALFGQREQWTWVNGMADTRTTLKLVIQLGGLGVRPLPLESGDLNDIDNCHIGSSDQF